MLTQKEIDALKPTDKRQQKAAGRGLFYILQPSGVASWALFYRVDGVQRKLTLGSYPTLSLKAAREKADKARIVIANGGDPHGDKLLARAAARTRIDDDSVESVVASFMATYAQRQLKPRTAKEVGRVLTSEFVKRWPRRRLADIKPVDVHKALDAIIERGSPYAANRALEWFKRLCKWAEGRQIIDVNPCAKITAPAPEKSRERVLSDDELKAVWRAAEAVGWPYGDVVRLLILTGARFGEATGLEWRELNLEAQAWTLPGDRTKNGRQHTIPLSARAVEILRSAPRIGETYVFTFTGDKPLAGNGIIKRRLDEKLPDGMEPWRLHDLRRTFASGLARLGTPIHVVEKLLNHVGGALSGVAGIYNRHAYADEQRAAADTWGRYVETLVSGAPARGNVVQIKARGCGVIESDAGKTL
jgi:integrase